MSINKTEILIENGFVPIGETEENSAMPRESLVTILSNLTYFGFSMTQKGFERFKTLSREEAVSWWCSIEPALRKITGDDKEMGEHVVYKNFPSEVLEMSEAEYWHNQILMYWGMPNELFTEEATPRSKISIELPLKVLKLADTSTLTEILNRHLSMPTRWTPRQKETVLWLLNSASNYTDISNISFKENLVVVAKELVSSGRGFRTSSATDVLRLSAALSEQDESLRAKEFRIPKLNRKTRQILLECLENCPALDNDLNKHKGKWKKLFRSLRPGDYSKRFPKVVSAYNMLYTNSLPKSFDALIEQKLISKDPTVLDDLQKRPGVFSRRIAHCISLFKGKAVNPYVAVLPNLTVSQLLKVEKVLTVNREYRLYPPKGNWTKAKLSKPGSRFKDVRAQKAALQIASEIKNEVASRVSSVYDMVALDHSTSMIKLKDNDSDLTPYGRGTVFPIPENVKFIRSASYWKNPGISNSWFDNGWNFFDKSWESVGACCWDNVKCGPYAAFSGDPTNSKTADGKACQMIDLYLDKLDKAGVAYAVWNVLCYSNITFSNAEEVYAALQWGESPIKGRLFEPSRCQLSFPLEGNYKTKYVAYIDVAKRSLIYMDMNLKGNVMSASRNGAQLQELMPAIEEYLKAIPSVFDLFKGVDSDDEGVSVLYSDSEVAIPKDKEAYVFRPENVGNDFVNINLEELLNL